MGEVHYLDEMAEKKTERLQIVLAPTDLEMLDEWRRIQSDLPNRSEAVRRLIGFGLSIEEWEELLKDSAMVNVAELSEGRRDMLIGKAIAKGIMAMSKEPHPAHSDMAEMFAILTEDYPKEAWMAIMPKAFGDLMDSKKQN